MRRDEVLDADDERYPAGLRELVDAPPRLHVRGRVELLSAERLVAVVGTRTPTRFGSEAARHVSAELAGSGWGIVSGLAAGIDTVAHSVAVEMRAPTIAVLGGGLGQIRPARNAPLAEAIAVGNGALVAEHPPPTAITAARRVARDRLQSALSAVVLVVESGVDGGSMHTARFAAEQRRPLLCVVPRGGGREAEGCRTLLESPASDLWRRIPAWAHARDLCERLGDRPVAHPVDPDEMSSLDGLVRRLAGAAGKRLALAPPSRQRHA